jgi:NADPH2:quinone reductase
MTTTARAVRFDRYGDGSVLHVIDVQMPSPGPGEVLVEVRACGINPGEAAIRRGLLHEQLPATFPSGQGSDLAGIVVARAPDVTGFALGDEVMGWTWARAGHASHVSVPVTQLLTKPGALSWEVAGSLYVVAAAATAAVGAVAARAGETVAVSAAAGGVGTVVVQLLRTHGVRVLAITSPEHADWLRGHGAIPVLRGNGLDQRLQEAAPDGIDAFIDLFGPEYLELAVRLGVNPDRIETIISFAKAAEIGARAVGSEDATSVEMLTHVAGLVADGTLEIPIASTYPLDDVAAAFAELEARRTHGKVVLLP